MNKETPRASLARKTLVIYSVVAASSALLYFLYSIQAFLLELFIALILALALAPLVRLLKRSRMKHGVAAGVAVLATVLVLLALSAAIATPLVTQGSKLAHNAPQIVNSITHNAKLQGLDTKYHLQDRAKQLASEAPSRLSGASSPVLGALGSVLGLASTATVIMVLTFFLLLEGPSSWKRSVALLHPTHAERVDRTAHKVAQAVSGFVTGNLLISLIAGLTALVILLIVGVPYAFALAALMSLLDLIPLIGATIAMVVLSLVALTQGVVPGVIVLVLLSLYQLVENNVIQPIVYSRTVSLSPLLILVASLVGAELAGIIGVLLAIPVAAAVQIIIIELLSGHTRQA